jgi:hypothetical protein
MLNTLKGKTQRRCVAPAANGNTFWSNVTTGGATAASVRSRGWVSTPSGAAPFDPGALRPSTEITSAPAAPSFSVEAATLTVGATIDGVGAATASEPPVLNIRE